MTVMKGRFIYSIFVASLFFAQFSRAVADLCDIPDPDTLTKKYGMWEPDSLWFALNGWRIERYNH